MQAVPSSCNHILSPGNWESLPPFHPPQAAYVQQNPNWSVLGQNFESVAIEVYRQVGLKCTQGVTALVVDEEKGGLAPS